MIEAVGDGVDPGRIGERVWLWNGGWRRAFGTAAELIALPAAQAVFLPIPKKGKAEFNPAVFNYQSAPGSPAVLTGFVEPEGDTECDLAAIWREVLNLSQIGRRDNFLELGGNSINAMQVTARMNDHFATDIPLSAMFETDSLEQLARLVDKALEDLSSSARRSYSSGVL